MANGGSARRACRPRTGAISAETGAFVAAGLLENAGNVLFNTFVLAGEGLTPRAAAAGVLIFAGVGMVIAAERRQRRQVPLDQPAGI